MRSLELLGSCIDAHPYGTLCDSWEFLALALPHRTVKAVINYEAAKDIDTHIHR